MTDLEMRQILARAMRWEMVSRDYDDGFSPDDHTWTLHPLPNPLESDRDAALLRAWLVGQDIEIEAWSDSYHAMVGLHRRRRRSSDGLYRRYTLAEPIEHAVRASEEPDPCRRERLALCRAVLQAIDAEGDA